MLRKVPAHHHVYLLDVGLAGMSESSSYYYIAAESRFCGERRREAILAISTLFLRPHAES